MAKQAITGRHVAKTIRVGGRCRINESGRAELTVELDGRPTATTYARATSQEAIYIATVKAMRRADGDGVTSLTIDSRNNLVKGHIEKNWKRKEKRLVQFQHDIIDLKERFDQVRWL